MSQRSRGTVTLHQSTYSAVVRLEVESRPESLTLVRSLLGACNNVVLHAYELGPGPLIVALRVTPVGVQVLVRDSGGGMRQVSPRPDRMGVGLAVIGALADRMEFRSNADGGTDVRMLFAFADADPDLFPENRNWIPEPASLSGEIVVSVGPVSLLAPVLARLTRAVAAQSRFTTDGIAEIADVTDAVSAYAVEFSAGESVDFALSATTRRLELTAGPFGEVELVAKQDVPEEPPVALSSQLEQPAFEPHGDRKLLRTVIVDERVSA